MIGYRYDDGGRRAAGYRGETGDCVVRAIAICAGRDYKAVYLTMAEHMRRNGYAASGNAYATRAQAEGAAPTRTAQGEARPGPRARGPRVQEGAPPVGDTPDVHASSRTLRRLHRRHDEAHGGHRRRALRDVWDGRTYEWMEPDTEGETRERKAQSVWVRTRPAPDTSTQTAGGMP